MKKKRRKPGRPCKLTAVLTTRICKLLEQGSTIQSACIISGFSERTFYDWQQRGTAGEEPFATFFSAATRAREHHKKRLIDIVVRAADKDARHAEWLLERQFPKEFAPLAPRVAPQEDDDAQPLGMTIVLNTGDKSYEELMDFPVKTLAEKPQADDDVDDGNVAEESFYELRRRGVV